MYIPMCVPMCVVLLYLIEIVASTIVPTKPIKQMLNPKLLDLTLFPKMIKPIPMPDTNTARVRLNNLQSS